MTDVHTLLSNFVAGWKAGRRPDVEAFLASVPTDEREELADAIEAFLIGAPTPRYDEQTLAELESSQQVREAERAIAGRSGTWPMLLPALRRQRRLTRASVAQTLATELGFPSAHERVREHLHDMETGARDARRVSRRVLVALGTVLGADPAEIVRAGLVNTIGGPTSGLTPTRRGFPDQPPFSEVPADYERPQPLDPAVWAEVDRLFLGGDS